MINDILGSAVSGLAAAQAGLRSVSNNIANVSTPGYAREKVNLTTTVAAGRVMGVTVGEPTRVADRFLEATVYRRAGDAGRAEAQANYLDRLQSLLGQPGSDAGLPARLDAIAASATAMTGAQGSAQTVASFIGSVSDGLASMQQIEKDVDTLRSDVESEVGFTVERVNGLLQRIYDLNGTVSRLSGQGRDAVGALDQRRSAIEELSELMSITVRDQSDGRVTIETASGVSLLDRRLRQLSYPSTLQGAAQPVYPDIVVRFAEPDGTMAAATGEKIDSAAVGGKLGGLIDLRDRALPAFNEKLGVAFGGLAEALNSVSNAGTTVPAPQTLSGRATGLAAGDRLGFTGAATFAVTSSDGKLVASTTVDFDALGAGATVSDMVAAINAGLGGTATASFSGGKLQITAVSSSNGVVVAQDSANPSSRAGVGVSQYFGLNDIVRSSASPLVPSGFTASDPHGFGAGETVQIVLRDTSGRALSQYSLTGSGGSTFGDVIDELNASPLAQFGAFSLDDRGRVRFQPTAGVEGAALSVASDSTDRLGTGRSFSSLMGLTGASSGLSTAVVRSDIAADPSKLPLAQLQSGGAVGDIVLGRGDVRGATLFVERLDQTIDMGKDGVSTVARYTSLLLGRTGLEASQAENLRSDAAARLTDATNRRDSYSGVNIDEELASMVVLQNSYSASARVISTATEMYDALLAMVG